MSILKQQKRLWFLAGAAAGGVGLLTLEREAWKGAESVASKLPGYVERLPRQEPVPIFGAEFFDTMARKWNRGIDAVFQPIINKLTDRGL